MYYAIENNGIQFAEEIARKYNIEEYVNKFDSIKTAKQDSIYVARKEKELQNRKWVFYNSGYYDVACRSREFIFGY